MTTQIKKCQYCGSEYEFKSGLQNLKNLWRKPSWNEWFIILMIMVLIVMSYFYYNEMKSSMYIRTHFEDVCEEYLREGIIKMNTSYDSSNLMDNLSGSLYGIEGKINSINLISNESR